MYNVYSNIEYVEYIVYMFTTEECVVFSVCDFTYIYIKLN